MGTFRLKEGWRRTNRNRVAVYLCPSGIRTVICQSVTSPQPVECENFDVRLVNGSNKMDGRLELCANGYWSNVCNDYRAESTGGDAYSLWTKYAAKLVCHKLGFPTEGIQTMV